MKYKYLSRKWLVILFWSFLVVATVVAFVGAAISDRRAQVSNDERDIIVQRRVRAATTGALNAAVLSVRRLEAFITARFETIPNASAPAAARVTGQLFPELEIIANQLLTVDNPIYLLYSFPGGVGAQSFPFLSGIGVDVLASPTLRNSVLHSIATGQILVESPRAVNSSFGVVIRIPIYNSSTVYDPFGTWWGNTVGAIPMKNMVKLMAQRDGTIAGSDWSVCITMGVGQESVVMIDERKLNPSEAAMGRNPDIVDVVELAANSTWVYEYWNLNPHVYWLRTWHRCIVLVAIPFAVAVVLVAWVNSAYALATRHYTGSVHAPKHAPMAMATIGIAHGSEMWVMCPEVLLEAEARLRIRMMAVAESHRAYVARTPAQHSHTLVTRSIDAAVHLSFAVVEDLERNPIIVELGDGGGTAGGKRRSFPMPLQVVCTVHWCKDVQIACDIDEERAILYEGRSVLFASRLYSYAIARNQGGQILVSRDAWELARSVRGVSTTLYDEVLFRQVLLPQEVYLITDPSSDLLRKAVVTAKYAANVHREYVNHAMLDQNLSDERPLRFELEDDAFRTVQPQRSSNSSGGGTTNLNRENPYLYPEITQDHQNMFASLFEPIADTYIQYEFEDLLCLFQHYYNAFVTLLKPIAVAERDNVLRKLSALFVLPQRQLLGHIAVVSVLQNLTSRAPRRGVAQMDSAGNSGSRHVARYASNNNHASSDTESTAEQANSTNSQPHFSFGF